MAASKINWRVKYLALEASYEALSAENLGLQQQIESMRKQQRMAIEDDRSVNTRAALMARAKKLAAQGTPCFVRGQHIFHSLTKEIIP